MKKILWAMTVGLAILLIWNGLTFDQMAKLDEENTLLKKSIEEAKIENAKNLQAIENNLRIDIEKNSSSLQVLEDNLKSNLKALKDNRAEDLKIIEQRIAEENRSLEELENKVFDSSKIYKKIKKTVVTVYANDSVGAGFLFGSGNLIVTAYHVVRGEPGDIVFIKPPNVDGVFWLRSLTGKIIRVKPEWDLAIIELEEPLTEPLKPANARNLSVGEPVIVIGTPGGLEGSVSTGVVSGLNRKIDNLASIRLIQFDASVYPGNSGGAVLNKNGEVIGLVSRAFSDFSFGFAVPVEYINALLKE